MHSYDIVQKVLIRNMKHNFTANVKINGALNKLAAVVFIISNRRSKRP